MEEVRLACFRHGVRAVTKTWPELLSGWISWCTHVEKSSPGWISSSSPIKLLPRIPRTSPPPLPSFTPPSALSFSLYLTSVSPSRGFPSLLKTNSLPFVSPHHPHSLIQLFKMSPAAVSVLLADQSCAILLLNYECYECSCAHTPGSGWGSGAQPLAQRLAHWPVGPGVCLVGWFVSDSASCKTQVTKLSVKKQHWIVPHHAYDTTTLTRCVFRFSQWTLHIKPKCRPHMQIPSVLCFLWFPRLSSSDFL